jgi:hypothetical protein
MSTTNDNTKSAPSAREAAEKARDEALGSKEPTAMLALRDSGAIKPVTLEEILAWRDDGRRF